MKKSLGIVLAGVMSFSLLVGCGSKNNDSSSNGASTAPADKTQISGTITVAGWDFIDKNIKSLLPEFNKQYPNIKVKTKVAPPADTYKQLLLDLSAGKGAPDVVTLEIQQFPQFMETGGLEDVTARLAPYKDQFNKYKIAAVTKDDKQYGVPWDSGPAGLFYRRDLFEKAGLPSDPEGVANQLSTWDKYVETAKIIKDKTGSSMLSLSKANNDARLFEMMMQQQGSWYFDKDGKVTVNNDKNKKILDIYKALWDGGLTENTQPWSDPWYAGIKGGKVATIPMGAWMGGFLKTWIATDAAGKWGVAPMPAMEEGGVRTANDGGSYLAITKQSKNKDAAWAFVEFMLTRTESHMTMFKNLDTFPSLETTYTDPYFSEKDKYFADQPYRQLFADLVKQMPIINYTKDYSQANSLMMTEIQKFASGAKDASKALADADSNIKSKTGR
jgi:lactose/L-arabinose transport system substrate-binding protein